MGRYDWEEKQQARERARATPGPWVSPVTFAVALFALLVIGAALFGILGSRSAATTSSRQLADTDAQSGPDGRSANFKVVGAGGADQPRVRAIGPASKRAARFRKCGMLRTTCVVDGDTFWLEGEKIRIADIDTPEVSEPQCAAEKELGDRATMRLVSLLNEGPFELSTIANRDEDQYGRKLRVVTRNGRSLGDQLVAEGLARTWTGQREPWC